MMILNGWNYGVLVVGDQICTYLLMRSRSRCVGNCLLASNDNFVREMRTVRTASPSSVEMGVLLAFPT